MNEIKTKTIYSLKLMNFLINHECELLEIRQHPHIKKYKCYVFEDNEHLKECIALFMKEKEKEEREKDS